jgi:FkbM family methyltransferase
MTTTRIKKLIETAVYKIIPLPSVPLSWSQAGEDAVLRFLFADRRISRISYLELGTNIPNGGNNTYLFYCNGSRGVCVEADKTLIPTIRKVRPEDKILNVGVAVENRNEADFYILDCTGMSTFDKDEAEKRAASGNFKIVEVVKVPLVDINTVIRDNFDRYPDLLSIDIEGLDLPVLKTLDFEKYPIPVICAETCMYSENHIRLKDNSIAEFMVSRGYEVYADTYINTIFVNKDWFYKI